MTRAEDETAALVETVVCVLEAVTMTTPVDVPGLAMVAPPTTVVMVIGPALLAEPEAEEDRDADEADEDRDEEDTTDDDEAELDALLADDDDAEDDAVDGAMLRLPLRLLALVGKTIPESVEVEFCSCRTCRFEASTISPETASRVARIATGYMTICVCACSVDCGPEVR